ncbi:uncharacterized protein BYT42DRAFT_588798 [Radiomyces spectabilis]|uniref:uncharacterized protein n=1 Tax=Radiomyces spectabilis TaxID=64574 RepID=UPI00221FCBFF|nr:uncharacterized protein BYT42DRAFT_588798 [Radiomyces spectabilis]KAI8366071.1 hypothetical protein BYT42DRAFT_588798 [Radiomyces spectabilis]
MKDTTNVQRAHNMIQALPSMSKTIVDDTLYEKVFSFLASFLRQDPDHVALMDEWNILDIIYKTCVQSDQDYRIIALCFRLLGSFAAVCKKDELQSKLFNDYRPLLDNVTLGLRTYDAALRCASLEAYRGFAASLKGTEWILENDHAKNLISIALMDQSTFVVSESCKFFLALIEKKECIQELGQDHAHKLNQLCDTVDPSNQIKSLLHAGTEQDLLLSALEFCWTMTNSKTTATFEYLQKSVLLINMVSLLDDARRIVRAKVLDILSIVFEASSAPLALLSADHLSTDSATGSDELGPAFDFIVTLAIRKIQASVNVDSVVTGTSLLERSLVLLKRHPDTDKIIQVRSVLVHMLHAILYENNLDGQFSQLASLTQTSRRPEFAKRAIARATLRALDSHKNLFPLSSENEADLIGCLLDLLNDPQQTYISEQQILKYILNLLLASAKEMLDRNPYNPSQDNIKDIAGSIIRVISLADLDCNNVTHCLNAFTSLIADANSEIVDESTCHSFITAVNLKVLDMSWDVRDAAVEYIGSLFGESSSDHLKSFAIRHDLPHKIFQRINDGESYVRASALHAFQVMLKSTEGWGYIQQHPECRDISAKLPSLLHDSEAFVRRASLDAITALVANRSCQGLELESGPTKSNESLNAHTIAKLMDDPDSEVTIRALFLLQQLWEWHRHVQAQKKRQKSMDPKDHADYESLPFFYTVKGDDWLIEASTDTQRLVRAAALQVIQDILENTPTMSSQNVKRTIMEDDDDRDTQFLARLAAIDLDKLKQTVDPEHIYQEAFDINAHMMTKSMEPLNPEDDVNMLDCY